MSRPMKVEQALRVLPDTDEMAPLRDALAALSREDAGTAWSDAEPYATVDTRVADAEALDAAVEAMAERVRARAETLMRHAAAAVRAMGEGDPAAAARALVAAGEVEEGERRFERAEAYYARALELGRKPRDRRAEGLAMRRLGRVARARGELERALHLYRGGYEVAEAQRDTGGMVVACQGLANVAVDQGRWDDARRWCLRGLELLGGGDDTPEAVHLCNTLAVAERRLGRLDESGAWLDRGEAAARRAGFAAGLGYIANARGLLHLARGDAAAAEAAYRAALDGELDPAARTGVMVNLAEPLLRQGRLAEAAASAREGERLALRHRVPMKLPDVYRTLGAVAQARGDAEGFLFFEQALDVCRQHRLPAAEEAATQHCYGRFEARFGSREAAEARLRAARDAYRALGAVMDAAAVAMDLAALGGDEDDTTTGAAPGPHTTEGDP